MLCFDSDLRCANTVTHCTAHSTVCVFVRALLCPVCCLLIEGCCFYPVVFVLRYCAMRWRSQTPPPLLPARCCELWLPEKPVSFVSPLGREKRGCSSQRGAFVLPDHLAHEDNDGVDNNTPSSPAQQRLDALCVFCRHSVVRRLNLRQRNCAVPALTPSIHHAAKRSAGVFFGALPPLYSVAVRKGTPLPPHTPRLTSPTPLTPPPTLNGEAGAALSALRPRWFKGQVAAEAG